MSQNGYARISVAAMQALLADEDADFAVFLPRTSAGGYVLYREAGNGLARPDLDRLRASGVQHLLVRAEDAGRCEALLEARLHGFVDDPAVLLAEKAKLVQQVGRALARDLARLASGAAKLSEGLARAERFVDTVIESVLGQPPVASQILRCGAHDGTAAGHMFMVSALAVVLGSEVFGADRRVLTELGMAGMLHDIGKLGIPPAVLHKRAALTAEETQIIHQHPIESVRLLGADRRITPAVRQAILQHHEWLDGRGYPIGVSGAELLPYSRVIAIVDSFHAMIGRRRGRYPFTPVEAAQALNAQAGRQFDRRFLAIWNRFCEQCGLPQEPHSLDPAAHGDPPSPWHEHRAARPAQRLCGSRKRRHTCRRRASVRCVYAGRLHDATAAPDEFHASLIGVSRGGMGLLSEHPMYRGEVVHVRLPLPSRNEWVRARVAWCRQDEGTAYRIGLRLVERIRESEAGMAVEVEGIGSLDEDPASRRPEPFPRHRGLRQAGVARQFARACRPHTDKA